MLRYSSLALCYLLLFSTSLPAQNYQVSENELQRIEQSLIAQRTELAGLRASLEQQGGTLKTLRQRLLQAEQSLSESEQHITALSKSLERASATSEILTLRLQRALGESSDLRAQLLILRRSFSEFEREAQAAVRSARRRGILYSVGAFLLGLGVGALLVN